MLKSVDCIGKLFLCGYWISSIRFHLGKETQQEAEQVNINAPFGPLDDVNMFGQFTESDVFDMLIFSECIESKIYSKLICAISATVVESTSSDPPLEIQVIKASLAALASVSREIPIYTGVIYTRAFRAIYSIYCTSKSPQSQQVAQAALTQITGQVFDSVASRLVQPEKEVDEYIDEKVLQNTDSGLQELHSPNFLEGNLMSPLNHVSNDTESRISDATDSDDRPHTESPKPEILSGFSGELQLEPPKEVAQMANEQTSQKEDIYAGGATISNRRDSDIILLFYIMSLLCILTNRSSVVVSSQQSSKATMKMHALRSNLISLHLIHVITRDYPNVLEMYFPKFCEYTRRDTYSGDGSSTLLNACRRLLRLAICTNLLNIHPQAFDITTQIVFTLFINHRKHLRKELGIILGEIILPILESKINALTFHKMSIITSFGLSTSRNTYEGKKALVEAYLNYDCDPRQGERSSIWSRLVTALAKITGYLFESPNSNMFNVTSANSIFGHYIPNPQTLIPGFDNTDSIKFYKDAPINSPDYYSKSDFDSLKVMSFSALHTVIECLYQWVSADKKSEISIPEHIRGVPLAGNISSTSLVNDSPSTIKILRRKKDDVVSGVKIFNSDPRKSIDYLLETKVLPSRSPKDIAHFITSMSDIDKSAIGEFIGGGNSESRDILGEFMALQDFTDMPIVHALRKTLQLFKIPGEAQKIDRIMHGFAHRYVECNPSSVFTGESAYIVSFSIIILNTDQHNENVKKRMTKIEFVKNVKAASDCENIPENILEKIYDSVRINKLSAVGSPYTTSIVHGKGPSEAVYFTRRQSITQNILVKGIVPKISDSSFEDSTSYSNDYDIGTNVVSMSLSEAHNPMRRSSLSYITASRIEHIMDMFHSVWASLLTSFDAAAEELVDRVPLSSIFGGFEYCLKITCIFDLAIERQAFISVLKKITVNMNIINIKKCIYSSEVLLRTAIEYGKVVSSNWEDILYSVMHLSVYCEQNDFMHAKESGEILTNTGRQSIHSLSTSRLKSVERASTASITDDTTNELRGSRNSLAVFDKDDVELQDLVVSFQTLLDEFFSVAGRLDSPSLVALMKSMKGLSDHQMISKIPEFHLSVLQRTSDLFCSNIAHTIAEWDLLWPILKSQLLNITKNENLEELTPALVRMYNSIVMKFLSVMEIAHTSHKSDMLMLFKEILDARNAPEVYRRIFFAIVELIVNSSRDVSGSWKTTLCIIKVAFDRYEDTVDKNYDVDYISMVPAFESISNRDCIASIYNDRALWNLAALYSNFCVQDRAEISSVKFVNILRTIIVNTGLHQKGVNSAPEDYTALKTDISSLDDMEIFSESAKYSLATEVWIYALGALVDIVMHCEIETRTAAVESIFEVMKNNSSHISTELWLITLNTIIYRMFDTDVNILVSRYFNSIDNLYVWISTTQIHALNKFVGLFCSLFTKLRSNFKVVLNIVKGHICSSIDITSRNGIRCLETCFKSVYMDLSDDEWNCLMDCISELFAMSEVQYIRLVTPLNEIEMEMEEAGLDRDVNVSDLCVESESGVNKAYLSQMVKDIITSSKIDLVHDKMPLTCLSILLNCLCSTYIDSISLDTTPSGSELGTITDTQESRKKEYITSSKIKFDACMGALSYIINSSNSESTPSSDLASDLFVKVFLSVSNMYAETLSKGRRESDISEASLYFLEKSIEGLCLLDDKVFIRCCGSVYSQILKILRLPEPIPKSTMIINLFEKIGNIYIFDKDNS